jgi:biofilm PGA synthesis N-glycosyltransferase PgaC
MFWTIAFSLYCVWMLAMVVGWHKTRQQFPGAKSSSLPCSVTVIVPFRNEEAFIERIANALATQTVAGDWEVIFVDDHSDDRSLEKLRMLIDTLPFGRARILISEGEGKKAALTTGIKNATGEVIVSTDADCTMGTRWLQSMSSFFQNPGVHLVAGGVRISTDRRAGVWQAMEFSALIGTGAATLGWGVATMANGANLAFRRQSFLAVDGYTGNEHIASGDDEFLLRKMASRFRGGVIFNKEADSIVTTQPQPSVGTFLQQRIRWASKWRSHKGVTALMFPLAILIFYGAVLTLPVAMLCGWVGIAAGCALLAGKWLTDFVFLYPVVRWSGVPFSVMAFIAWQFLYPLYAIGVGILANVSSYSWKQRTHASP